MNYFALLSCLTLGGHVWAGFQNINVVDFLKTNGFSNFSNLLADVHLQSSLSGHGPFTIFAPTDAAFQNLDPEYTAHMSSNRQQLLKILQYHIVPEYILSALMTGPETKQTLEGQWLNITTHNGTLLLNGVARTPNTAFIDNMLSNGVVFPVDSVLIPPVMGTHSIAQILIEDDSRFKDLFIAMLLSNMIGYLEKGDFTFFAPVDLAFAPYAENILHPATANASIYYNEILRHHMVPGGMTSHQLRDQQKLQTIHGTTITVTKSGNGIVLDNRVRVLEADIPASNGVVYAVDGLLIPKDLFPKSGATTT